MDKGLPLLDKRILIPREKKQARSFSSLVKKFGGIPVEIPLLSFRPAMQENDRNFIIENLHTYDWIIFTSNVTVETFLTIMERKPLLGQNKIAVIGQRTKSLLNDKGISVEFVPSEYVAEVFVDEFLPKVNPREKILIPKGNLAREYIGDSLRKHGCLVDEMIVYETFLPEESRQILAGNLVSRTLDVLLFTSPSTVDHFMEVVEEHQLHDRVKRCIIGCIGPVTHKKMLSYGLQVHISPNIYTVEELVNSTVCYYEKL